MRQLFFAFFSSFFLIFFSCGDGDVIDIEEVSLDFDETFQMCGELVLFQVQNNPAQTLSIFLNGVADSTLVDFREFPLGNITDTLEIRNNINGSTNRFNLRTYEGTINGNELFCTDLPPNITILSDDESDVGEVVITTVVIEEDNDNIPWQDEDDNSDNDDNPFTNPIDTDGDGLPNYIDSDDDNDNIPTVMEDPNEDGDNNPFTNARDSDGDSIPDYLDPDDDNDGVLTRDEENFTQDANPLNDITNADIGPDYLNPNVAIMVPGTEFIDHIVVRNFITTVEVFNFVLENLTQTALNFGTNTLQQNITLSFD